MNAGKKKLDLPNPRADANCLSSITYAWTIPIFKAGFNRDLDKSDLYTPLDEHSAGRLGDKFSQLWNEELKNGTPSLSRVIFYCFKWNIILFFSLTLILDCVIRILQPIFLGKFISYFTAGQEDVTKTQLNWYAFGLIMSSLVSVVLGQTLAMAIMHLGLKIKTACCSLIYRKSLKLSKSAIGTTTVGQVVNLLANDVNRVETVTHLGNYMFVAPIQTLIITFLMWQEIGVSAIIGVAVLLTAVPLQLWLGKKIAYFRTKTVGQTDERMQRMSEIVAGIRVIKMYAWEQSFAKVIEYIRKKEMKWIYGSSSIRGVIVSFALVYPRMALFCSILCYAALGNQITAQKVFVVTSFYTLLKQSMNTFFPRAISFTADFLVSAKRIDRFLLFEETIKPISTNIGRPRENIVRKSELSKLFLEEPIEEETTVPLHTGKNVKEIKVNMTNFDVVSDNNLTIGVNKKNTDEWNKSTNYLDIVVENEITLEKVYVKWIPTSSENNLSNITLNIKRGSFVAIVGSVGSGKSTLLNTILKEIPLHMGTMDIHGEVSYASQDPWLFDATIRENILFGSKMDRMRYNKVIQKCALDRDFILLPHGDKTFAGELGCNLSGGQKARVNLARAVYRQADIYLFDDPLSAVDAHVGRQLFNNCMEEYLENKTRLLVTHQLQYLDEVERIIVLSNGCVVAEGTYAELEKSSPDFKLLSSQVLDKPEADPEIDKEPSHRERLHSCRSDDSDDILEDEQQEELGKCGSVDGYVYRAYIMATGSKYIVLMILLTALSTQFLASYSDYWTSYWVNMEEMKNSLDCRNLPPSLMGNVSQINDYDDNNMNEYYMETTKSIVAVNSDNKFSDNTFEFSTLPPDFYNNYRYTQVKDAFGITEYIIVSVNSDELLENLKSQPVIYESTAEDTVVTSESIMLANSDPIIENLIALNDSTGITESIIFENSDAISGSTFDNTISLSITNNNSSDMVTQNYSEDATLYLLHNTKNENKSYLESSKNFTSELCCEFIPPYSYTKIYTILIIFTIIMVLARSQLFFWAANRASSSFHRNMFDSISRGTMRFFNLNPSGRILNRFAKDMSAVDEVLPTVLIDVLQISLSVLGIYIITIMINFWLVVPILSSIGVFIILRAYYISTSRSVFRLVGTTRSPTLSHLSASLQGITTIRAFGNQRILEKEFDSLQNVHTSASYLNIALSRAFGFWLDSTCVLFIAIVVLSFIFAASSAQGGNVGLVISQVLGLVTILQYALRISTQMENEMISVERILDYIDIEHEAPSKAEHDDQLPPNWPQDGRIEFNGVSLRYSPTKAPAIRELSVVFSPKKKIGIVGRTGAGKSSIINALFRLEFIEGTIEIDGYRTNTIGLFALRSKLSIIPQEPVLFSGSIRSNLDPFDEYSDEAIWNALEQVELKLVLADQPGGLSAVMSEGGTNFSVGQRQLFCLARAIIRNNPILILDEATANVDQETDALIQRTIRNQFADCTVLTIAHRLQTVMDSDKVLVMDAGRMVEYDHPYILLLTDDGFFQSMAKEYGKARMETFMEIAKKSYEEMQQKNYT